MKEFGIIILLLVIAAIFCFCLLMYCVGYVRGMKETINIDNEYDKKFKKLIVDFVTENYVKKGETIEENQPHQEQR